MTACSERNPSSDPYRLELGLLMPVSSVEARFGTKLRNLASCCLRQSASAMRSRAIRTNASLNCASSRSERTALRRAALRSIRATAAWARLGAAEVGCGTEREGLFVADRLEVEDAAALRLREGDPFVGACFSAVTMALPSVLRSCALRSELSCTMTPCSCSCSSRVSTRRLGSLD